MSGLQPPDPDEDALNHYPPLTHMHRTLPTSPILLFPKSRPGRKAWSTPSDPSPNVSYGDTIREKSQHALRIFFQNVKGLTYSTGFEDYHYYMLSLKAYGIDIAGLAETNTAWQHQHLQQDFRKVVHRHFRQSKVTFGGPLSTVDPCPYTETFQSGGTTTVTHGPLTSSIYGDEITDSSGLGRWAGITLRGKGDYKLSIITAYRTCGGSINTSSLGSVYSREFLFFRDSGIQRPNPRRLFFQHIGDSIRQLQDLGHHILLMLDANSDLSNDYSFSEFISECDLHDLHHSQPPPSTYIGSAHRRIDYILGCTNLLRFKQRSGSLSYYDGPHSDHRCIFVDLEIPELCSLLSPQKMSPASHRALHTGNPELVSAYLEVVKQYYAAHKMEKRMDSLYRHHQTMDRPHKLG